MAYWIFQCNPNAYEYDTALTGNLLEEWNVKQHKNDIHKDDKAVIWFTGKTAGVYAIAKVTSNPTQKANISSDNHLFNEDNETGKRLKEEDKTGYRVTIDIVYDLRHRPILKERIKNTNGLQGFKAGRSGGFGTNLTSTEAEYNVILSLI
jgi:hypothetical protein